MSAKAIDEILNRWMLDPEFRDLLQRKPKAVLASYNLTKKEREALSPKPQGRLTIFGQSIFNRNG